MQKRIRRIYSIAGIVAVIVLSIGWSIIHDKRSRPLSTVLHNETGDVAQKLETSKASDKNVGINHQAATRKVLQNIKNTGIDAIVTQTETTYTIEFSDPVNFASLTVKNNPGEMVLKALKGSGELIDMDVGDMELNVFGEGIITLLLSEVSGKVSELSFIPALQP